MNRIRIGLWITIILTVMYAASAFLVSRTDFAIGMTIASAAAIGLGLCDAIKKHRMTVGRAQVWERRRMESGEW